MNHRKCSLIFVCAMLIAGGIGKECYAQLYLCLGDDGEQAIKLHMDLADCEDARNAALDAAALAINNAFAAHAAALAAADATWEAEWDLCSYTDPLIDLTEECRAAANDKREAAIAAADAALAAPETARDAAVAAAEAAYNNCVANAYALYESCVQCCFGGGRGGGEE